MYNRTDLRGGSCQAILLDLGPSPHQLHQHSRGFNLDRHGNLDLRYTTDRGMDCRQLLRLVEFENLTRILRSYGGVIKARTVASSIIESRLMLRELTSTSDLQDLLVRCHQSDKFWKEKEEIEVEENINKVVLALRIFINNELNETEYAVQMAEQLLEPAGLLVCRVQSNFELNFLKKLIYKTGARISMEDSDQNQNVAKVKQTWTLLEGCWNVNETLLFSKS